MASVMKMNGVLNSVDDDAKALANLMQTLTERVVAVYESLSIPVPDRCYWTLGEPAVDCEQIVVTFIQMYLGAPGAEATEATRCNDVRSATVHIRVSRQVPIASSNGRPPTAEEIQLWSNLVAYDAWALLNNVQQFNIWGEEDINGPGVIATVDVAAPEGGYHTTVLTLTVAVP